MIRFVLKSALAIGLLATVLPLGDAARSTAPDVDVLGVLAGAQQAASDLGGFCERAPQACEAAGQVAGFAGERIGAGIAIGYDYLSGTIAEPRPDSTVAGSVSEAPDPVVTGAVGDAAGPRPYTPPQRDRSAAREDASVSAVAVPTPAPRT